MFSHFMIKGKIIQVACSWAVISFHKYLLKISRAGTLSISYNILSFAFVTVKSLPTAVQLKLCPLLACRSLFVNDAATIQLSEILFHLNIYVFH